MSNPGSPRPTLGLAMIVRNEADNIERCLRSALPHIDYWTIVDTGSEDATMGLIAQAMEDVPGELYSREWQGFGHNRSELFDLAKGTADHLLLLDADMVLHMPDPVPELTADCYHGRILGASIDYTLPLIVNGKRNWRYEGVAHSYLACDGPYTEEELPGLAVEDYSSTGIDKLRRDRDLLSAELANNPLDARTAFYLAQTYYDLDMFPEAIAAYRYRANLDGWSEETYYAKYMLGVLLCEHVSFNDGCKALMDAWNFRPSRIEPLRVIANVANSIADRALYPTDKLFVHRAKYVVQPPAVNGAAPMTAVPPRPPLSVGKRLRILRPQGRLSPRSVSAIYVTRGNVSMDEVTAPAREAGITDIVIWDNSRLPDYKVFGRYAAIPLTKNPVLHWVDDDVIFTAYDELFDSYRPGGRLISNMDQGWVDGAGYGDFLGMVGAGSLCPAALPDRVFGRYLARYPFDEDLLLECDFAFGVLAPFTRVDLGYQVRDFTDDADRLYQQPGQTERKWSMINRCRAMLGDTVTA